jgi:DNA-binding SARP family transcriptional activator
MGSQGVDRITGIPKSEGAAVFTIGGDLSGDLFDLFPYGIVVLSMRGRLRAANAEARALLIRPAGGWDSGTARCCHLLGCRTAPGPLEESCLSELTSEGSGRLPEMRIDLQPQPRRAVWLTAAPLGEAHVVLVIRPGDPHDRRRRTQPHWRGERQLLVRALGHTEVEDREGSIGGAWLEQRPGQILKFLVSRRYGAATAGEIAGAIWPDAGRRGLASVRHHIHELRDRLEPDRSKRRPSSFVISRQGGYALDAARVSLDVEDFEREVKAGLRAAANGDLGAAKPHLERGLSLYRGDLFAEDPYCEWVITEREPLRDMANDGLRALAQICASSADHDGAYNHVRRLAEAEPYDVAVQRELVRLCLCRNRYSEAERRYQALRTKMLQDLGEDLKFALSDIAGARYESAALM